MREQNFTSGVLAGVRFQTLVQVFPVKTTCIKITFKYAADLWPAFLSFKWSHFSGYRSVMLKYWATDKTFGAPKCLQMDVFLFPYYKDISCTSENLRISSYATELISSVQRKSKEHKHLLDSQTKKSRQCVWSMCSWASLSCYPGLETCKLY